MSESGKPTGGATSTRPSANFKWVVICIIIIFVIATVSQTIVTLSVDIEVQRITACTSQLEMEYIDGDCRRVQPDK